MLHCAEHTHRYTPTHTHRLTVIHIPVFLVIVVWGMDPVVLLQHDISVLFPTNLNSFRAERLE